MKDGKVRVGFIGAGWWATSNHMPLLAERPDVELTAVCRLGRDELERVRERFGFRAAFEDYRTMLREVELDAVFVASPHTLHFEHARAALEHGLHVLCEKPMCTRAEDARELVRLADERGLHLVVPYGWHYKPFVQEAKRLLDVGGVGEIQYVLCHMASPVRRLLSGEQAVEVEGGQAGDVLFTPEPATWADPEVAGGGYGHAQISHSSGMLFWLTGLRPKQVYAQMSAPRSRVDLYDALSVTFEGGAIGTVSGAGTVPEGRGFQLDIRVFGSDGMLLLDVERERMELRRHDGADVVELPERGAGDYSCEGPPHNFIDLVQGRATVNHAPGWAATRSVEMLDAAYRSALSGRPEAV
ncbi:MAG TPA: Gfo/Idh/MocA family oxidoreductase [Armatimonadota bacterium]|nr:Gfo/Idh/MocA family oxidoreductase [Armatimonadota bacterium]